ncbi:MAG: rod shape-determining protein MreD [Pseudomonadota bacterium]
MKAFLGRLGGARFTMELGGIAGLLLVWGVFTLAMLAEILPIFVYEGYNIRPLILLAVICFWNLYAPQSLHLLFLFVMGMIHDVLLHNPLGVSAFLWILVAIIFGRLFASNLPQRFWSVILLYGAACAGFLVFEVLVAYLLVGTRIDAVTMAIRLGISLGFYPLLHRCFLWILQWQNKIAQ